MSKLSTLTPIATVFALSLAGIAHADNPFAAKPATGFKIADAGAMGMAASGAKEGHCGANKAKKEGKCGEGKCGAHRKAHEGHCGADKGKKEGSCGANKGAMPGAMSGMSGAMSGSMHGAN